MYQKRDEKGMPALLEAPVLSRDGTLCPGVLSISRLTHELTPLMLAPPRAPQVGTRKCRSLDDRAAGAASVIANGTPAVRMAPAGRISSAEISELRCQCTTLTAVYYGTPMFGK